jgi:hypothetical protein
MIHVLSEQMCYERAAEARRWAEEAQDPEIKASFLIIEERWLTLARSCAGSNPSSGPKNAI